MNDTGQLTAETPAAVIENTELWQQLAGVQDHCVELVVDAGEIHASIDALQDRFTQAEHNRNASRVEAQRRLTG